MIRCDYLIIGAGFSGIALKYKLLGKTILIDKNPFPYKIGESHIPDLIHADPGLFSLISKLIKMKSYTRKLGTVFCDSYHGQHASNLPTALGERFTFHCERPEIEKLLVKELSVEIRREKILNIDLDRNIVKTNLNIYKFNKYLLDCSGPAMVIANKLNMVAPIDQFQGMKAQWSYWTIDRLKEGVDSWAHWTVLNKIAADSWIWQIPIYNSSILSMGMLHRGEPLPDDKLIEYVEKRSAACYQLTSIAKNPERAIKPYMAKVHSRLHYSRRSQKCSGPNWILVGDAYCFADPVYSVGSGVATLEAVTIANNLNKNEGRFDHQWYEKNCNALIASVIKGISTWYSGTAFDKSVNEEVNNTVLRGGFARHFCSSPVTEGAVKSQQETIDSFLMSLEHYPSIYQIKVYYFDKSAFLKKGNFLTIIYEGQSVQLKNKAVAKVFEDHVLGKKLSFNDLFLIVELNLRNLKDRAYFWNVIRLLELVPAKAPDKDRLYYFHPERYELIRGQLKLGEKTNHLMVKDRATIDFFEGMKAKIVFGKSLEKLSSGQNGLSSQTKSTLKQFLRTFDNQYHTFGRNFIISQKPKSKAVSGV